MFPGPVTSQIHHDEGNAADRLHNDEDQHADHADPREAPEDQRRDDEVRVAQPRGLEGVGEHAEVQHPPVEPREHVMEL